MGMSKQVKIFSYTVVVGHERIKSRLFGHCPDKMFKCPYVDAVIK